MTRSVLALNGGSSSLKVAAFESKAQLRRLASVNVVRIGASDALLSFAATDNEPVRVPVASPNHEAALETAMARLGDVMDVTALAGIGHRVVHGGPKFHAPQLVSEGMLTELRRLEPFDPEHLPAQVGMIEACGKRYAGVPQVACFDTAFHHDLPAVARRLAIPRRFDSLGVRRYGFHGLSYAYLMSELERIDPAAGGRVILAHLGNGASLAAVLDGKSIDTSMAFTPAAGIPMGTRSGDLDPGLIDFLARAGGLTLEQFNRMVHLESGLLGVSETSSDMERLLEIETKDSRAGEAVDLFCYQVAKQIGAYAAALGGLDVLVFAGGIGERARPVRWRICERLRFLGVELDAGLNDVNSGSISKRTATVKVRVIPTDEEVMIAREVLAIVSRAP